MTEREDTENPQERLVFVDIDEGDPFEGVELSVIDDGTEIRVGTVDAEPGRYVLAREEGDRDE